MCCTLGFAFVKLGLGSVQDSMKDQATGLQWPRQRDSKCDAHAVYQRLSFRLTTCHARRAVSKGGMPFATLCQWFHE